MKWLLLPQLYFALYWECFFLGDHLGKGPPPAEIRVFSQNVFLLSDLVSDDSEEKMEMLLAKIEPYDILLLQEVWSLFSRGRRSRFLARAREMGFPYSVGSKCQTLCDGMLLIVSRFPIEGGTYTFKNRSGIEQFVSKGIVWARSGDLYFFNTHLQAYGEDAVRRKQLQEVTDFIGNKTGVLGGDFNMNIEGVGTDPIPPLPTWGKRGGKAEERLDYLLLFNLEGEGGVDREPYSDHSALWVTL